MGIKPIRGWICTREGLGETSIGEGFIDLNELIAINTTSKEPHKVGVSNSQQRHDFIIQKVS